MRKTWPNFSSYLRFSAARAAFVSSGACMARLCSRSEVSGASPPRSPMRGWAFIAANHSSSVSRSIAASADSPAATACAQRRLASTPYSLSSRSSLNAERHQLEAGDVDEAAVGDLQLGDDGEGQEAQGHEGRGHRHAHLLEPRLH